MKLGRRLRPSRRQNFWIRPYKVARLTAKSNIFMNKYAMRTWYFFKWQTPALWLNAATPLFQYQGSTTPLNDPNDVDLSTASTQRPYSFQTNAKLFEFFLADCNTIKSVWTPMNYEATTGVQGLKVLSLDWIDDAPTSASYLDSLSNSIVQPITYLNIEDRLKNKFTLRFRQYNFGRNTKIPKISVTRNFTIRKWIGSSKTDFTLPFDDPAPPYTRLHLYGTGTSAPVSPINIIYHHHVVINLAGMQIAPAIFPVNANTPNMFSKELGMYTRHYSPLSYLDPNPL